MGTSSGCFSQATEKKLGDDQVRGGHADRRADERASRGADGLFETEGHTVSLGLYLTLITSEMLGLNYSISQNLLENNRSDMSSSMCQHFPLES